MRSKDQVVQVVDGDCVLTGHPDAIRQYREDIARSRAKDQRRCDMWGSGNERMTRLCRRFPSLAAADESAADGVAPWNVERLLAWAFRSGSPTSATWHALSFVLQVWNHGTDWPGYLSSIAQSEKPQTRIRFVTGGAEVLAEALAQGWTAKLAERANEVEIEDVDSATRALWVSVHQHKRRMEEDLTRRGYFSHDEQLKEQLGESFARVGPFNPVAALGVWDRHHAAAFLAWCEVPFWP